MSSRSYADMINQNTRAREVAGISSLIENLGGMYGDTKVRGFHNDIANLFTTEGVSPETLQKARSMYPNVNPKEILGTASAIDTQKKAQTMKDIGKTISSIVKNSQGELNLQEVLKQAFGENPELGEQVMQNPELLKGIAGLIKTTQEETKILGQGDTLVNVSGKPIATGLPQDNLVDMTTPDNMHVKIRESQVAAKIAEGYKEGLPIKEAKGTKIKLYKNGKVMDNIIEGSAKEESLRNAGWMDEHLQYKPETEKPEKPKTPEQVRDDYIKVQNEILKTIEALKQTDDPDEQEILKGKLAALGKEIESIEEEKPWFGKNTKKVKFKNKATAPTTGKKPPAGYKDTGRTMGGKKVYSDGKNALVE